MQGQKQVLVQQQRLNLSPQLVQSIKLMAMPFADLRDRILEEVEKNPALEIVSDPFESGDPSAIVPAADSLSEAAMEAGNDSGDYESGNSDMTVLDGANLESALYGTPEFRAGSARADTLFSSNIGADGEDESDEHRDFIEGALHREETLQEHLLAQLSLLKLPSDVHSLASLVIQNLDKDGFHIVPPEELPSAGDAALLERALEVVRGLEPAGCATRDFRESLLEQARLVRRARGADRLDPVLEHVICILERHFDALEKGRPEAIVKALAKKDNVGFTVDAEEAEEILDIIRSFDPFPGRTYGSEPVSCVVPDVIVKKAEDEYAVVINDEEIPVLGVSPFFMELEGSEGLPSGTGRGASAALARDFARESVKEARWFIGTLQRRNLTILKLARALVVFQRDFFMYGPSRLAPLRMKDIADEIGMHEATVSRAANGKYLQCEWGLFELRYFFSNQVGSTRGASSAPGTGSVGLFSKQGVKEVIRELLANSGASLSDQKIADQLALRGIKIARRTVAKYRSELTIGSSFDR